MMDIRLILRAIFRNKLRFGLTAAQIAATLAIVTNCVALIQDARRRMRHPTPFDEDNLIQIRLPCQDTALKDRVRRSLWVQEARERLHAIPGVRSVASTHFSPYWPTAWAWEKAAGSDAAMIPVPMSITDERLPDVLGMELDEGRWFSREEVERAEALWNSFSTKSRERAPNGKMREPLVTDIVITRALGRQLFGDGPLIGKMLEDEDGDMGRIVGIISRYYHHDLIVNTIHSEAGIFYPGNQHSYGDGANFVVRAEAGHADVVARRIEEKLSEAYDLPERAVWLVSELRDIYDGRQRMTAALMFFLVFLLLVVASIGIAGLTSFSITARTRQIGIRRALGATTNDILRYFLTESSLVTMLGLVIGSLLAVLLNMAVLRIYDSAKLSAPIIAGCVLLLWFVALGAALPPALRASRISPAIATRNV